eukprot:5042415-Prymnesium_polylepis.1
MGHGRRRSVSDVTNVLNRGSSEYGNGKAFHVYTRTFGDDCEQHGMFCSVHVLRFVTLPFATRARVSACPPSPPCPNGNAQYRNGLPCG